MEDIEHPGSENYPGEGKTSGAPVCPPCARLSAEAGLRWQHTATPALYRGSLYTTGLEHWVTFFLHTIGLTAG
jgi:hypothetical protein